MSLLTILSTMLKGLVYQHFACFTKIKKWNRPVSLFQLLPIKMIADSFYIDSLSLVLLLDIQKC